jgi:hypothetical protein
MSPHTSVNAAAEELELPESEKLHPMKRIVLAWPTEEKVVGVEAAFEEQRRNPDAEDVGLSVSFRPEDEGRVIATELDFGPFPDTVISQFDERLIQVGFTVVRVEPIVRMHISLEFAVRLFCFGDRSVTNVQDPLEKLRHGDLLFMSKILLKIRCVVLLSVLGSVV